MILLVISVEFYVNVVQVVNNSGINIMNSTRGAITGYTPESNYQKQYLSNFNKF